MFYLLSGPTREPRCVQNTMIVSHFIKVETRFVSRLMTRQEKKVRSATNSLSFFARLNKNFMVGVDPFKSRFSWGNFYNQCGNAITLQCYKRRTICSSQNTFWPNIYIYIYIYMYIYMYVYICTHTHTRFIRNFTIYMCVCVYVCVYVNTCILLSTHTRPHPPTDTHTKKIYICVCVYVTTVYVCVTICSCVCVYLWVNWYVCASLLFC
jgi:hypothetical protein